MTTERRRQLALRDLRFSIDPRSALFPEALAAYSRNRVKVPTGSRSVTKPFSGLVGSA
jgi:hypothetical protein